MPQYITTTSTEAGIQYLPALANFHFAIRIKQNNTYDYEYSTYFEAQYCVSAHIMQTGWVLSEDKSWASKETCNAEQLIWHIWDFSGYCALEYHLTDVCRVILKINRFEVRVAPLILNVENHCHDSQVECYVLPHYPCV